MCIIMIECYYDLHIHSCLSPCSDDDMTPSNIAGMSYLKGLNLIAVCDHNSCLNVGAVTKCADEMGITVIPGMELETSEEVHCLCYFKSLEDALYFNEYVEKNMPKIELNRKIYGEQSIMNENDEKTSAIDYLLSTATNIDIETAEKKVHQMDGIFIPAHFDKASYSVSSNLGFLPPEVFVDGIEIFKNENLEKVYKLNKSLKDIPVFYNSDAHNLALIKEKESNLLLIKNDIVSFFRKIKALQTK